MAQRKQAGASDHPLGLQLTEVERTVHSITWLAGGQVIQQRAQLLGWVEQQHHPMQAELAGELLTEAGLQFVGGGSGHGETRLLQPRAISNVLVNTRTCS